MSCCERLGLGANVATALTLLSPEGKDGISLEEPARSLYGAEVVRWIEP